MLRIFFLFFFSCLAFPIYSEHAPQSTPIKRMQIHIFTDMNGKGLEADARILKKALEGLGQSVQVFDLRHHDDIFHADINIHFQWIVKDALPFADINWLLPNPEWYVQDFDTLKSMDLILCKTKEAKRIFQELGGRTYFLGFTSEDCFQPDVEKDYNRFLHVGGNSAQKGTKRVLKIWQKDKQLPLLTLIKYPLGDLSEQSNLVLIPYRISKKCLDYLQNRCGIHLCPSETEGFGHYMMEAMSAGAVVITTNAPPMNEFVTDPRCLVSYRRCSPYRLGMNYYVDSWKLKETIQYCNNLSREELQDIGNSNRKIYLEKVEEFSRNLEFLIRFHASYKELFYPEFSDEIQDMPSENACLSHLEE